MTPDPIGLSLRCPRTDPRVESPAWGHNLSFALVPRGRRRNILVRSSTSEIFVPSRSQIGLGVAMQTRAGGLCRFPAPLQFDALTVDSSVRLTIDVVEYFAADQMTL